MEDTALISVQTFVNNVTEHLAGTVSEQASILKINNENLSTNGELHFLHSLKAWNSLVKDGDRCSEGCATILEHSLRTRGFDTSGKSVDEIVKEAFGLLVSASRSWPVRIAKCALDRDRVCLHLDRSDLLRNAIKLAVKSGTDFGRSPPTGKAFRFEFYQDKESELTTKRLHLIRNVTESVLRLQGHGLSTEDSVRGYEFTTKSEGRTEGNYKKYVCGVVKNASTNAKETELSWDKHIRNKVDELRDLNEQKFFEEQSTGEDFLRDIAKATAIFELLSVKPSRPVFIGHGGPADRSVTNTKGAPFILYNTARIATIIARHKEKESSGEYPKLPSIDETDFSYLNQEDEWELVFAFVIGYPRMIRDSLRSEPLLQTSPQVICLFLSRLCQKFSVYYRKVKILTEAYDHLIPALTARLYMLHALQVVLQNALEILDINPMSRM